jgi:hypothetical protein
VSIVDVADAAPVVDVAEADAVELAVATAHRLGHLPREAVAMRICCAAGNSFEAEVAGSVHVVEDP